MKEYLKVSLLPKDTNMHGTIFGGVIMSHLDLAGAICARDSFDNRFVTLLVHEIRFLHPVFVGDLLMFGGEVVDHGSTSVTVRLVVEVERIDTREVLCVTEARIVYVAVDRERRKTRLQPRSNGPGAARDTFSSEVT
ncbi:MAG: hotdog domain-containing protein [Candidatus Krumholzibacteriia bacterium]